MRFDFIVQEMVFVKILEQINPYPVTEALIMAPWDSPEKVEAARRNLRTVQDPYQLARLMSRSHGDSAIPNALHDRLNANVAYKFAKNSTPFLKDAPAIARYRKLYGLHDNVAVIAEIFDAGICMPAGQVLFRGGPWPENNSVPPIGASYFVDKPLSTSLCPQVAAVHSCYSPGGLLWIITLETPVPCFVFDNKNRILGHEFEVLLPPLAITCRAVEDHSPFIPLIQVSAAFEGGV